MQASVAAYLDAVIAGQQPPVTGASALDTVRLLDRIYRTAWSCAARTPRPAGAARTGPGPG